MSRIILMLFLSLSSLANSQTKFAMFGDYGCDEPGELAVSQLVKSWNPDFIVTLGDNNYYTGINWDTIDHNIGKYYHEYIKPYMGQYGSGSPVNRFFPALGNHDFYDFLWFGPNDIRYAGKTYYSYFKLTDTCIHKGNTPDQWSPLGVRYYKFRKGNVEFFIANSGSSPDNHPAFLYSEIDGIDSNSFQAQWFKTQITNSTAKWKIVVMHHPPYGSVAPGLEDAYRALRWNFKQWGATAVVSGHHHTYESLVISGFPYFIAGLGGEDKNPYLEPDYPGSRIQYHEKFGSMQCIAYEDSLVFKFINVDNELIDYYKWVTSQNDVGSVSAKILNEGINYTGDSLCFDVKVKNFGSNSLFFVPVKYSINDSAVTNPLIISSLDASDSSVISFCGSHSFIPEVPGEYLVKFFTGYDLDTLNSNDTTSIMITVVDSSRDAGAIDVIGIPDTIHTGVNLNFRVKVKNFGLNTLPFIPVHYLINDTLQISSLISDSVAAEDTVEIQFTGLNSTIALDPGYHKLKIFTGITGDTNTANDTLLAFFTVRDSSHDAGVTSVTNDTNDRIYTGTRISFHAMIRNFGYDNLPFVPVKYVVNDTIYERTILFDSLGSGDSLEGEFSDSNSFVPESAGIYTIKFFTNLTEDNNRANDTSVIQLNVVDSSHDAGISFVNSNAPGRIYTGTNISFNVTVKNFGLDNLISVPVRYSVNGTLAVGSMTTGFLSSGDSISVEFSDSNSFTPTSAGDYLLGFFTDVSYDLNRNNDTSYLHLTVVDSSREAGILSVSSNALERIYTGTNISFAVKIKNFGADNLPFVPLKYVVNDSLEEHHTISDSIAIGDSLTVSFTDSNSFTPDSEGEYAIKFITYLSRDENRFNDTAVLHLTVVDSSHDAGVTTFTSNAPGRIYTGTDVSFSATVKNFGLDFLQSVPVMLIVNDSVVEHSAVSNLMAPGDSILLDFANSFTPNDSGEYKIKFITALPDDDNRSNDTSVMHLTVVDSSHDAGVTSVTNNTGGRIYSGSIISFSVGIKNFGFDRISFVPVRYNVNDTLSSGTVFCDSLLSGDSILLQFTDSNSFVPMSAGQYTLKFFTSLFSDNNRTNDTAIVQLDVVDSSRDAGITSVISNAQQRIYTGSNISFSAKIKNFGLDNLPSVPVRYVVNDSHMVSAMVQNPLSAGDSVTIEFTDSNSFAASSAGEYTIKFFTDLLIDDNRSNDTTLINLTVVDSSRDAGISSINGDMQGRIYTNSNISFDVNIKNYGLDNLQSIPVAYSINDSIVVSSIYANLLQPGDSTTLVFSDSNSFRPDVAGEYQIKFFTALSDDNDRSNDTALLLLTVVDSSRDAGVASVTSNTSERIYTGTAITFDVTIRNYGIDGLQSVPVNYVVNDSSILRTLITGQLSQGDSISLQFSDSNSFIPDTPGDYSLKFYTSLSNDSNRSNDTLTLQLTVVDSSRDAGITSVSGNIPNRIYTGTNISFNITIKNFGLDNLSLIPVTYTVNDTLGRVQLISDSLTSGDSVAMQFADSNSFNSSQSGEYILKFFTGLPVDDNRTNDTVIMHLTVVDSSRDAGVITVNSSAPDRIYTGTSISFDVMVRNFGFDTLSSLSIGCIVNDSLSAQVTLSDSLTGGDSLTLQFSDTNSFTAAVAGEYTFKFFTSLPVDDNRSNDTARMNLIVVDSSHDAGVVSAAANVSGTLYMGMQLTFHINVKNFGLDDLNHVEIGYTLNDSSSITNIPIGNLGIGDTMEVSLTDTNAFTPWYSGLHEFKFFTMINGDLNNSNDTFLYSIEVIDTNLTMLNVTLVPQGLFNLQTNGLNIKDSIMIMMKSADPPYNTVDSAFALLDSIDYSLSSSFPSLQNGRYFVVVSHRNSLETWSNVNTIADNNSRLSLKYDFTTDSLKAFGNNLIRVSTTPQIFALFSGDVNQDGAIDLTDIIQVFNDANEFLSGYRITDLNGDFFVDLTDITLAFENANRFVTAIRP